jgi:hypothetical protein
MYAKKECTMINLKTMIRTCPIVSFFVMTFLFAWGIWLPVGMLAPHLLIPLTLLGAWAPTLAGVICIALNEGNPGIRDLLRRSLRWKVPFGWYLVSLFGIALLACAALALQLLLDGPLPTGSVPAGIPREGLLLYLPLIFVVNIFLGGPLAEDIGWRGYILPRLSECSNAFSASLVIGVVWAFWHLPFFFLPGGLQVVGEVPFFWFALLTIAWSVLFAWVYVNTQSVLIAVLLHAAINTTLGSLGIMGQPASNPRVMILNVALTWLAVILIVSFCGPRLLWPNRSKEASGKG